MVKSVPTYQITEADGSIRTVEAENLSQAIRMADVPHSVTIEGECPAAPDHKFVTFTASESEGKKRLCLICGLIE